MAGSHSNLYQEMGGTAACRELSAAFYTRVAQDPILRPLFPGKTLRCATEAFAAFLVQFLGGPSEDTQHRWWLSLRESHARFPIGRKERDAWMRNMIAALEDVRMEDSARRALLGLFEKSSAYVVNTEVANEPPGDGIHPEIADRWDAQRALDAAVAAVRGGHVERAIAMAESPPLRESFERNRAVFANLLAVMLGSGHRGLVDYVERSLLADPALGRVRFGGRTLLHAACGAGNLRIVELLLGQGADPNVRNDGGHTPLYCVGNECTAAGGGDVVRALVRAGAKVDACDGVKHCTPLHMAARRGNVEVAEALLDCGADIEMHDVLGDTPLRRAVNCGKTGVAAALLSRGADLHSKGSKGLTPVSAARTAAMRSLLRTWSER